MTSRIVGLTFPDEVRGVLDPAECGLVERSEPSGRLRTPAGYQEDVRTSALAYLLRGRRTLTNLLAHTGSPYGRERRI